LSHNASDHPDNLDTLRTSIPAEGFTFQQTPSIM